MGKKKREIGEVNSSSMADIAFLLLIFFLVTTSMSTSTGLARRLPQPLPPDVEVPPVKINERNILVVKINRESRLMVGDEEMDIKQLRKKAMEFIKNEHNDPHMPAKYVVEVPILGPMETTKEHVISVVNELETPYQAYIDVQNEIVAAYNHLRNEFALQKFGKGFYEITDDERKAVQTVYPMNISEAEPRKYGGTK